MVTNVDRFGQKIHCPKETLLFFFELSKHLPEEVFKEIVWQITLDFCSASDCDYEVALELEGVYTFQHGDGATYLDECFSIGNIEDNWTTDLFLVIYVILDFIKDALI